MRNQPFGAAHVGSPEGRGQGLVTVIHQGRKASGVVLDAHDPDDRPKTFFAAFHAALELVHINQDLRHQIGTSILREQRRDQSAPWHPPLTASQFERAPRSGETHLRHRAKRSYRHQGGFAQLVARKSDTDFSTKASNRLSQRRSFDPANQPTVPIEHRRVDSACRGSDPDRRPSMT